MTRGVLRTRLCDLLGIRHPVVQAGMGYVARGRLAAEVSSAGGLGVIGTGHLSADELREEIRFARSRTSGPVGAAVIYSTPDAAQPGGTDLAELIDDQLAVIQKEHLDVLVVAPHFDSRRIADLRAGGMKILSIVMSGAQARAVAGEIDAVIAQGCEASGNVGSVGTIVLVPHVVDLVDVPVLAAGGIADGRGLAAALTLGADGVYLGTRFLATREAYAHHAYKDRIVVMDDEGTVVTRAHSGVEARLIRNNFTDEWELRRDEIKPYPQQMLEFGQQASYRARIEGDIDNGSAPAGQSAALIGIVAGAADVVKALVEEAQAALARLTPAPPG